MKIKFLILIVVIANLFNTIHAQTFHWAHNIDTKLSNGANIISDKSGGVYSSGSIYNLPTDMDFGPNTFTLTPGQYKANAYIARYQSNSDLYWAKLLYSQDGHCTITDMSIDSLKNIYIIGSFTGNVDFDPGPNTFNLTCVNQNFDKALFIEKLDSNGNFLWAKKIDDSFSTIYSDKSHFIFDSDGNILILSSFKGIVNFNPNGGFDTLHSTTGLYNSFLLKLDSQGQFIYVKKIAGGENTGVTITIDNQNLIIICGVFQDSIDADLGIGVSPLIGIGQNNYIIKINSSTQLIWAEAIKSIGGNSSFNIIDVNTDDFNNIYTVGSFNNSVNFDPSGGVDIRTSNGDSDAFITKLNSAGGYIWTKTFGGILADDAKQIIFDTSGFFYVLGFAINIVDLNPNLGVYMINTGGITGYSYLSKFSLSGQFIDAFVFGDTSGGIVAKNVCYDNEHIYMTGTLSGSPDFDPSANTHILTSPGVGSYMFISKYSFCGTHYDTTIHACNTINLWGTNYDSSKHFIQYFLNANECDSNMNVNLIMQYGPTDTIQQTVCKNFTINNVTYNSSGVYVQHFPIGAACDSLLIIDLQVTNPGNLTISQIQDTLRVTPTNYTYQWIDCATNLPINGANDTIFVPASPGSYKVVAYFAAGCSDTSSCKTVGKNVGLNEQPIQHIKIYPNPTSETFTISTEGVNHDFKLSITDLLGKILFEQNISPKQNQTISLANFANGAYFIRLENEKINFVEKIIKTN